MSDVAAATADLEADAFYRGCLVAGSRRVCDAAVRRSLGVNDGDDDLVAIWSSAGLVNLMGTLTCITIAALAAGMTMGIVSLDAIELRVKIRAGTASERRCAKKLLPLVEREPHHQVLVTLLLLNSAAAEALPLFLDELVPTWAAVIISVTAVLFVGEILPSAVFTSPARLAIAARLASLLGVLVILLAPIAWPLAKLLDRLLPAGDKFSSHAEVGALLDVTREAAIEAGSRSPFNEDEADLVRGAMSLSQTDVCEVMCHLDRMFTLRADDRLDPHTIQTIVASGFSRIPVIYERSMTAYIMVKEILRLYTFDYDGSTNEPRKNTNALHHVANTTVGDLPMYSPVWIAPDHSLFELLNEFQTGSTHMAFVSPTPHLRRGAIGLVTLEDIIEVILTEEIYDEADRSNAKETLRNFISKFVMPKVRQKREEEALLKKKRDGRPPTRRLSSATKIRYGALTSDDSLKVTIMLDQPPAPAPGAPKKPPDWKTRHNGRLGRRSTMFRESAQTQLSLADVAKLALLAHKATPPITEESEDETSPPNERTSLV